MGKKTADSLMWGASGANPLFNTLYLSNQRAISGHIVVKNWRHRPLLKSD
jgi:hypothetical protein